MNILYFSLDATTRGRRCLEVRVAEDLVNRGHTVHLVTPREPRWGPEEEPPDDLHVTVQPLREAEADPGRAADIIQDLDVPDVDVVFSAGAQGAFFLNHYPDTPTVCQLLDVPLWRIQYQGSEWEQKWRTWADSLFEADHVVLNHEKGVADWVTLCEWFDLHGVGPEWHVVYYGCDTDLIDEVPPAERPLHEDVEWTGPIVGVLSRLAPYKGIDTAIRAISLLPEDEQPLLFIMGNGRDRIRLANLAYMAGVSVLFENDVTDREKVAYIKLLDAYVYPDYNPHVSGLTPIEAAYAGTHPIVSDLPINKQRMAGIENKLLTRTHDTRAWADRFRMVSETHAEGGLSVSEKDRDWVRENRSVRSHADGLEDVFEDATG